MNSSNEELSKRVTEVEWEVWYRDTFDRECPPKVDVSGVGMVKGLKELWARHLFETVTVDGILGFSRFHLRCDGQPSDGQPNEVRCVMIDGDLVGASKLRGWMFGDKEISSKGYVGAADSELLTRVAEMHADLVLADRSSSELLQLASRCSNGQEFAKLLDDLVDS
ncbi:MAG: hypothetical protein ACI9G1_005187 [Pirellulaceae bacterium]|jgi:hypothetical protein